MPLRNRPNLPVTTVLAAVAAAGVTALGLAGCAGEGGSQGSVTTADVTAAQTRITGATSPCPFPFDVAAAAKKAGVTGPVTAGAEDGTTADGAVHPSEAAKALPTDITSEPGMPPSIPAHPSWTEVECDYRVGAVALDILVVATPAAKSAIDILLPVLQRDNKTDMAGLDLFVKDMPKPGDVRLGPGPVPAGVIRVPVKGSGDVALLVGQEAKDGTLPLSSDAIRRMTGELAREVHS